RLPTHSSDEAATADDRWAARTKCSEADRGTFQNVVRTLRVEVRKEIAPLALVPLNEHTQASIERISITRALLNLGYLTMRRMRLTQPIPRRLRAMIS